MIKIQKIFVSILALLLLSLPSYPQDKRTTETKVADLLARLPANDLQLTDKLMGDMLLLGEPGIKQICDQIIPAGTGDDTKPKICRGKSFPLSFQQKGERKRRRCGRKYVSAMPPDQKDPGVR